MKVAVVTGSNKGIGFAIVRQLCEKFSGVVYLTARDKTRGEEAVKNLQKDGYNPAFHTLDIDDMASIVAFRDFIANKHGGIDVLVNNAAIAYKKASNVPFPEQAQNTIRVNFKSTMNVCRLMFPLLRPHARVVNVSSSEGMLSRIPSQELQQKFINDDLTEEQLSDLVDEFVKATAINAHTDKGWGSSAYAVSKVAVTALSRIQQRQFDKDSREDLIVNAVHPGYVDTDMTSHMGPLSPEQGAEAPVYLALLPPDVSEPKGQMVWYDKRVVTWLPEN